jgi:L-asparagine transporter-like permease
MQKIPIKKYAFRLIVFSAIIAALTSGIQLIIPEYTSPALPFIILFFFVITLFTLYIVLRSNTQKKQVQFISSYLLSRIIKLFSCLLFLAIYILCNKEDALRFAVAFMVIYFLYAFYEIFALKDEKEN